MAKPDKQTCILVPHEQNQKKKGWTFALVRVGVAGYIIRLDSSLPTFLVSSVYIRRFECGFKVHFSYILFNK